MYEYTICNSADALVFAKQCLALEEAIPNLVKADLLMDVDESQIQPYTLNGEGIIVYNDTTVDAVYIRSKIALEPFFE